MVWLSLALNVLLLAAVLVVVARAKTRIAAEKSLTYGACVGIVATALLDADASVRCDLTGRGFSRIRGGLDLEQTTERLLSASRIALIRRLLPPATFDLMPGENVRELARSMMGGGDTARDVLAELDSDLNRGTPPQLIAEAIGVERLARAQLEIEDRLVRSYRQTLDFRSIKLW